ncbi:hypothetical protein ACIPY6_41760 [Streptomyces sp. NPDC090054]|uniref:hypothetical protein n=1 Tax=Streptomyces sp. NPDC090054 TaxID=3365933 RepID=UPI0038186FC5
MTNARDIMTADATCIGANETVLEAAQKMAQLKFGAHCRSAAPTKDSRAFSPTATSS